MRSLLAFACVLAAAASAGCDFMSHSPCRVTQEGLGSPDGRHEVVIENWVCKKGWFGEEERTTVWVKSTKLGVGDRVFGIAGRHRIVPVWLGESRLRIECPDAGDDAVSHQQERLKVSAYVADDPEGVPRDNGLFEVFDEVEISYKLN